MSVGLLNVLKSNFEAKLRMGVIARMFDVGGPFDKICGLWRKECNSLKLDEDFLRESQIKMCVMLLNEYNVMT